MIKQIDKVRHSLSHLLAMAVLKKYPDAKLAIGPVIENGFYYDFDLSKGQIISEVDFPKLEKEMKKLILQNLQFKKFELLKNDALKKVDGPYKKELIKELPKGEKITFYQSGDFVDLCAGPHVKSTKEIRPDAFCLTSVAGAYWRGDEKNKMLTRIYGVAFQSKKELDDYLEMLEEAEKRDHRKLGKELELFMLDEDVGQGLPLWLPKGAMLKRILETFILDECLKRDYELVWTPHIGSKKLFNVSGHLDFYKDSMYSPMKIDDEEYYLKPMNCPMQVKIYNNKMHSYRDLPVRYAELGTVYRYEKSGTLHGLTRVRGITQDDAHIICTPKQLEEEVVKILDFTDFILKTFGLKNYKIALSVRDPQNKKKYLGADKDWDMAEESLIRALKKVKWDYYRDEGEAVFYGPKIDIKVKDVIGREWQLTTVQFDFNLPAKFDMNYIDEKGKKQRPFMIHRAILGAIERFVGVLIEHFAGAFPLWLAPVQIKIISVGSAHKKHCEELADKFSQENIRVETDLTNETVGNKIRKAIAEKMPYMLVIGDKEIKSDKLTVRVRGQEKLLEISYSKFVDKARLLIKERSLDLI